MHTSMQEQSGKLCSSHLTFVCCTVTPKSNVSAVLSLISVSLSLTHFSSRGSSYVEMQWNKGKAKQRREGGREGGMRDNWVLPRLMRGFQKRLQEKMYYNTSLCWKFDFVTSALFHLPSFLQNQDLSATVHSLQQLFNFNFFNFKTSFFDALLISKHCVFVKCAFFLLSLFL